ncbi:CDP-glucose 4,6-dehydratase [compost metagenome]
MEKMGVTQFGGAYEGTRVLVTGHTGFKGSWLAAWLDQLRARVTGLSLDSATEPNHWDLLPVDALDLRGDVRDRQTVLDSMAQARPEIVFHLAAQTLVRESYGNPLTSWSTNVMGTANVLEACRLTPSVRAVVIITTDKVYANREWHWGYRENDELGGHDPYSASKAACEILVESYRKSFWSSDKRVLVASARAGNVVGGGDWAPDRLVPDLVRAVREGRALEVRSPAATRPWQHVLDCLSGYLMLGQQLLAGNARFADSWNFGPAAQDNRSVAELLGMLTCHWPELAWKAQPSNGPHEAGLLLLDCAKARQALGWNPALQLDDALAMTAHWYRHHHQSGLALTQEQLRQYVDKAASAGCGWVKP